MMASSPEETVTLQWPGVWPGVGRKRSSRGDLVVGIDQVNEAGFEDRLDRVGEDVDFAGVVALGGPVVVVGAGP